MKFYLRHIIASTITILLTCQAYSAEFSYYAMNVNPAAYQEGGVTKGYYAEILQRIAKELGQDTVKINLAAYPRILHALNENNSGYVLTCLFPSSKFNEKVNQPSKVGHFQTGIVSMKSSPFTWENAKGKKVATVKGASKVYGKKFHDMIESGEIKLTPVTDYKQAISMLSAGRIDGFAGNLGPLLARIKSENIDIAEPAIITEKISNITISVAPGTPDGDETLAKINDIVTKLLASGEIQDIIEKYLPDAPQPR